MMPYGESTGSDVELVAAKIVDAAFQVHTKLGEPVALS